MVYQSLYPYQSHIIRLLLHYTGDFIAKWCTEHRLTEQTAHHLRKKGFTYPEAIGSMRPEDVIKLGITNTAQECLLRELIGKKNPRPLLYSKWTVHKTVTLQYHNIYITVCV